MILTLGYRGVFRQAQYETVTIEASVTVDTGKDLGGMSPAERRDYMTTQLDTLIAPVLGRAIEASQYDEADTVLYQWKEFNDAATDEATRQPQGRRTHRRS